MADLDLSEDSVLVVHEVGELLNVILNPRVLNKQSHNHDKNTKKFRHIKSIKRY